MAIADGTYEVLPLLDVTMALAVSGNSAANSAAVITWARLGSNAQKWSLATVGTITTITDAETGKALAVAASRQADGTRVIMYTALGSLGQQWLLTEDGTQTINGTSYKVVTIGAFGASTYMLDATGGTGSDLGAPAQVWTADGSDGQKFVLVPTEWLAVGGPKTSYAGLPTPSEGGGGTTQGTTIGHVSAVTSGTLLPCWMCPESKYQVRYRTRTRDSGAEWFDDWSDWKSIADASTAWYGWGAPGSSNCTPTLVDGLQWSTSGVAVDNSSTYDRTDVEFGVRSWRSSWGASSSPAHGADVTYTMTTVRPVTVSSVGLLISPDGLSVTWVTTATHDDNVVTVESDLWGTYTITGGASGTAEIPQHLVSDMPGAGDTADVTLTMTTIDGLSVTKTSTCTAAYEGTHGTSLTLSSSVSGTIATVTASDNDAKAWLVIEEGHGTRFVPLDGSSPWKVAPPLNKQWKVLATVVDVSSWSSVVKTFNAISDKGWHVTSQDMSKDLAIYVNAGERPSASPSFSRSFDSVEVMGRERPVYVTNDSTEVSWTLEGVVYGSTYATDLGLADWATHAGHVYFRSPQGDWRHACVTGGSVEVISNDSSAIELSMRGEVW